MRFAALIPVIAALAVHAGSLDNPFVYDDHDTVLANPSLAEPMNARFVLVHSPFRPVVNVSYAFDRLVWGFNPFGFHLTNLLLHAAVVWLLFAFVCRALHDARLRRAEGRKIPQSAHTVDRVIALLIALGFAVHPILTEAVGYVSGRSELLCGMFLLIALMSGRAALAAMDRSADRDPAKRTPLSHRLWLLTLGAIVSGILALLSKEVAVAIPILLLAYDWLVLPGPTGAKRRRLYWVFAPVGAVTIAIAVWRLRALLGTDAVLTAPHLNLLTQAIVIWRYVQMLVLPAGQSIMHAVRFVSSPSDPAALLALGGMLVAGWLACRVRRSAPLVPFGFVWFLAALAPSSSVVSLREGMAEHRVYVASAGLLLALGGWMRREPDGRARTGVRPGYLFAAMVILLVLSILTVARYRVWEDPVQLWTQATVRAPGMWEPHYALADTLRASGRCALAVPEYEAVLRLRPAHRDATTNLGICLAQEGRFEEAEKAFNRALEIDPDFPRGFTNLGALAIAVQNYPRAREMYLEALKRDPGNVLARLQLARLYEEVFEDYHAAARMCGEARAIQPSLPGVVECVQRNQKLAADKDAGR